MNTSAKGRNNEHRIRDVFEEFGYWVIRAAGSKGEADIIAVGDHKIFMVNVKTNQFAPPKERQAMEKLLEYHRDIIVVLARFDDGDTKPKFKYFEDVEKTWKEVKKIQLLLHTQRTNTSSQRQSIQYQNVSGRKATRLKD